MNVLYLVRYEGWCYFVVSAESSAEAKELYKNQKYGVVPHFSPQEIAIMERVPDKFLCRRIGVADTNVGKGVITGEILNAHDVG